MSIIISSASLGNTLVRASLSPTVSVSLSVSPCLPGSLFLTSALVLSLSIFYLESSSFGGTRQLAVGMSAEEERRQGRIPINERWQSRNHPQGFQYQTLSVLESCEGHTEFDVATLVDVGIELLSPLFEHP